MLRASMIEKYYTKVALPVTRRSRWSPTDLNVRDVGAAFGAAISAVVFFFFLFRCFRKGYGGDPPDIRLCAP